MTAARRTGGRLRVDHCDALPTDGKTRQHLGALCALGYEIQLANAEAA